MKRNDKVVSLMDCDLVRIQSALFNDKNMLEEKYADDGKLCYKRLAERTKQLTDMFHDAFTADDMGREIHPDGTEEAGCAMYAALQVMLLDPDIRQVLDEGFPMAVRQAENAVKGYEKIRE